MAYLQEKFFKMQCNKKQQTTVGIFFSQFFHSGYNILHIKAINLKKPWFTGTSGKFRSRLLHFLLDGLFLFLWPNQNGIGFSLGAWWLWPYLFPQHIFVKQNIESYVFIEWYCFSFWGLYQITWHLAGGQAVPNCITLTKHAVSGATYPIHTFAF